MCERVKIRVLCKPNMEVKESVDAYNELNRLIIMAEREDAEPLYESFRLDEDDESIYFDPSGFVSDCEIDYDSSMPDGIEFAVISERGIPEEIVFDVFEFYFPLTHYIVFSYENESEIPDLVDDGDPRWVGDILESLEVAGCIKGEVLGWNEIDQVAITQEDKEDRQPSDYCMAFPENDKMKHEMFLMAMNGFRLDFRSDPDFFNQNELDDRYMYEPDRCLPNLDDWMIALFERKTRNYSID